MWYFYRNTIEIRVDTLVQCEIGHYYIVIVLFLGATSNIRISNTVGIYILVYHFRIFNSFINHPKWYGCVAWQKTPVVLNLHLNALDTHIAVHQFSEMNEMNVKHLKYRIVMVWISLLIKIDFFVFSFIFTCFVVHSLDAYANAVILLRTKLVSQNLRWAAAAAQCFDLWSNTWV